MSDSGYANSDKSEQQADSSHHKSFNQQYWEVNSTPNSNYSRDIQNQLIGLKINLQGRMASNTEQPGVQNDPRDKHKRLTPVGQNKPPPIPVKPTRPQTLSHLRTLQQQTQHNDQVKHNFSNSSQNQGVGHPDSYGHVPSYNRTTPSPTLNLTQRGPPPPYEYYMHKQQQQQQPGNNRIVSHKGQRSVDSTSSSDTSQRNGSDLGSSGGSSLPVGYGGWSPSASVVRASPQSDEDRKRSQVAAYTQWVNIQLKRRHGSRPVEDLQQDMRDGVALAHLIEIIAGVTLEDIHENPRTISEMEMNVEQAIQFMSNRRIRMHHITASDIVSGSIKPIMRLILALAAHFKPNSVRQSSASPSGGAGAGAGVGASKRSHTTVAGIAQGAAAALADIKRDALRTSQRPRRPRHLQQQHRQEEQQQLAASRSETASPAQANSSQPPRPKTVGAVHSQHSSMTTSATTEGGGDDSASDLSLEVSGEVYAALAEEHAALHTQMADARAMLLTLQQLLLSGQIPAGHAVGEEGAAAGAGAGAGEDSEPAQGSSAAEEVVLLRARLQQSEELTAQLRADLSKAKQEAMQLQGVKSGLAERLKEQEESLLVMKAELLRAGFGQQTLEATNSELRAKLEERDHTILDLRRECARRERDVEEAGARVELEREQREAATRSLRAQITDLHARLRHVGETEATLSARVASQDRKMARLEGKILHPLPPHSQTPRSIRSPQAQSGVSSDEYQVVRDSLQSLRTRFPGNHPQNQTIDQLETSISTLMDRLHARENEDDSRVGECEDNKMQHQQSMGDNSGGTKLLYFTDRTVTPFMCTVHKRLGDITLADVKALIDRPAGYRYHFKAMDPEFGTVKEEISHDDDVIPGWEGKIVAWIEDHS